jgi:hypothetical protein
MKNLAFSACLFAVGLFIVPAQAQDKNAPTAEIVASGGQFVLQKTVTAGGGVKKEVLPINENGTTGQTVAGVKSTGGSFSLYSGFWTPDDFAPTAASAVVGGRVLTAYGAGIRNVQLTIIFPSGEVRYTTSTTLGYYRFTEIPVGGTYVVTVAAKIYNFTETSQIRQVAGDLQDVDFVADEAKSDAVTR